MPEYKLIKRFFDLLYRKHSLVKQRMAIDTILKRTFRIAIVRSAIALLRGGAYNDYAIQNRIADEAIILMSSLVCLHVGSE